MVKAAEPIIAITTAQQVTPHANVLARAKIGTLSIMYGSTAASPIGAGAGILTLLDNNQDGIELGINALVNNVTGSLDGRLYCGANNACALKLGQRAVLLSRWLFSPGRIRRLPPPTA